MEAKVCSYHDVLLRYSGPSPGAMSRQCDCQEPSRTRCAETDDHLIFASPEPAVRIFWKRSRDESCCRLRPSGGGDMFSGRSLRMPVDASA